MKTIFSALTVLVLSTLVAIPAHAGDDGYADVSPTLSEFNLLDIWTDIDASAGTAGNAYGTEAGSAGTTIIDTETGVAGGNCGDCSSLETTFRGLIGTQHQSASLTEDSHQAEAGTAAIAGGMLDVTSLLVRGGNVGEASDGGYSGDVMPSADEYGLLDIQVGYYADGGTAGTAMGDTAFSGGVTLIDTTATINGGNCGDCSSLETTFDGSIIAQHQSGAASQGAGYAEASTAAVVGGSLDFHSLMQRGGNVEDTPVDPDPGH